MVTKVVNSGEMQRRYSSIPKDTISFVKTKRGRLLDEQRAHALHELQAFQYQSIAATEQFKRQMQAMHGIYKDVSGDANAF